MRCDEHQDCSADHHAFSFSHDWHCVGVRRDWIIVVQLGNNGVFVNLKTLY